MLSVTYYEISGKERGIVETKRRGERKREIFGII